jgi:AcrR family transcriptional regulator
VADGRQSRWRGHNLERRQLVLEAALLVINESSPGEEVRIAQIAARTGINRSALYRYFEDRADLEVAVQREICARAGGEVLGAITLDGTPREIVHRIIATYSHWAVTHTSLLRFVERDVPGSEERPLEETIAQVAMAIEGLIAVLITTLGVELTERDRGVLDPWAFGLVGGVMQAVRRWSSRADSSADLDHFVEVLTQTTWSQVLDLASSRGIAVPDLPVETLVPAAAAG